MIESSPPRILYVVNNAAFFVSHRLPLALAALRAGSEVALVTGQPGSAEMEAQARSILAAAGLRHEVLAFSGSGLNPLRELLGLWQLIRFMRVWHPAIVHCASPKGLLYGGLAARLAQVPGLVLAVSGMGFIFTDGAGVTRRVLRVVYRAAIRFAFRHPHRKVIVQNEDDLAWVKQAGLAPAGDIVLIPGSGVDLAAYQPEAQALRDDLVLLPARLLQDKGVLEFVQAAARVRELRAGWRFVLVGAADYDNPTAITANQVRQWQQEGHVEWWGHCANMPGVYARASIVCLPSYREGMPKSLLEAAAAGCAVVTTDVVGCREAVIPGVTADLVPARDVPKLVDALLALIDEPHRRERYGRAGRELASERFGLDSVVRRVMQIYQEINVRHGPSRVKPRRWFSAVAALLVGASLAFLAWSAVDNNLTPEDAHFAAAFLPAPFKLAEGAAYPEELAFIRLVQRSVLDIAQGNNGIPFGQPREPRNLYEAGSGLCYDRSRSIEKILRYHGFRTRHVAVYSTVVTGSAVRSLLTPGTDSHAITEVLTRKGWLVVDSNHPWVSVQNDGDPVPLARIHAAAMPGGVPIAWQDSPPVAIYRDPFTFIYGLYSRHGRFYAPYNFVPDVHYGELLENLWDRSTRP
jgi:glycosyltransferase involved in cell wall biosynthesis